MRLTHGPFLPSLHRLSTTGLCMLLAVLHRRQALLFLAVVALDIGAHWAQMYASLLAKAASHKDVAAATSPLLRLYYSKRLFMGALCVGAEVFYLSLYALAFPPKLHGAITRSLVGPKTIVALPPGVVAAVNDALLKVGLGALAVLPAGNLCLAYLLAIAAAPLWALKQLTNVLQGQFAAQRLVAADA